MKYILVTGGVISGIGKGVTAASLGVILKHAGLAVTSIKIDPYINIDAGCFSPYEHGEVYVLDDGGEVDLDLGNYERFLNVSLSRDNNITTGKIYQHVINKERRGDFLGVTVQVVPHITDAIQQWVERVASVPVSEDQRTPEVCIIELGGTIGDIEGMPFIEAFRQFQFKAGKENFCNVHVSLVPRPSSTGEHKTKPTQASVRELRGLGLTPDLIFCRSEQSIDESVRKKISNFCHVEPHQVINIKDQVSIYHVPIEMIQQDVHGILKERLKLDFEIPKPKKFMIRWRQLSDRAENLRKFVKISLVGKYTQLEDAYASVIKALQHAALASNHKLKLTYINSADLEEDTKETDPVKYHDAWKALCQSDGVLVPGGFGLRGVEGKIQAAKWCRVNNKPFLGVCLGLQCAVIEYARNVCGLEGANSSEMDPDTKHPVVIDMPEHNQGQLGGTMRLGKRQTMFNTQNSILRQLYGNVDFIEERHRHRYEVNPEYVGQLEAHGMKFVGRDTENVRMEIMELNGPGGVHPYYAAVQYHPEYISRPLSPSPPYLGLILASVGKLQQVLSSTGASTQINEEDDGEISDEEISNLVKTISYPDKLRGAALESGFKSPSRPGSEDNDRPDSSRHGSGSDSPARTVWSGTVRQSSPLSFAAPDQTTSPRVRIDPKPKIDSD